MLVEQNREQHKDSLVTVFPLKLIQSHLEEELQGVCLTCSLL